MNEAIDMSQFVEAKSDQLNADDLIGNPRTITVRKVTGNDGDQPVSIYYDGDNDKPFKPCKTARRVLLAIWGRNAADYVGRSMTIYRDDSVTFGGLNVGGIRISHMSHIDKKTVVVVMKTKGKKAGIEVNPLVADVRPITPATDELDKFAAHTIATVNRAPDLDKFEAFVAGRQGKIDGLSEPRPDLWQTVTDAIRARRIELTPADADAIPAAHEPEGRATEDMGEGFTGADETGGF